MSKSKAIYQNNISKTSSLMITFLYNFSREHVWYKNPLCAILQYRVFNTSLSLYYFLKSCVQSTKIFVLHNTLCVLLSLGAVAMEIDDLSHSITEAPKGSSKIIYSFLPAYTIVSRQGIRSYCKALSVCFCIT